MQKKYSIIGIAAVLVIALALACSSQNNGRQNPQIGEAGTDRALVAPVTSLNSPVPIEMLGHGARLPTAEELEQERQFALQKIALAEQRLKSSDTHQRVIGTEQLNAYQMPLAEQLLLKTLKHDVDPIVRKSAAQSLGLFKVLSDTAVDKLLDALKDKDMGTRKMVLDTLLIHTTRANMDNQRSPQILFKLKRKLKFGHLHPDISKGLQAFVDDQKPIKNAFLPQK